MTDQVFPTPTRNVTLGGRATSGRLAGADPISWNPFSAVGLVLAAELRGFLRGTNDVRK
jgi:hypothetical protein